MPHCLNSLCFVSAEAIVSVMVTNSTVPISSENFILTCEVTGPYIAIYWMKNSTVLNGNATDYRMENNTLHFIPVTTDNDGTYQCVATNMAVQFKSPMYTLLVNCEYRRQKRNYRQNARSSDAQGDETKMELNNSLFIFSYVTYLLYVLALQLCY